MAMLQQLLEQQSANMVISDRSVPPPTHINRCSIKAERRERLFWLTNSRFFGGLLARTLRSQGEKRLG